MTNRLDIRLLLRECLEDTAVEPLWDDALLNSSIWNAMLRFGARVPLEATHAQVIPAGATVIPVTPNLIRTRIIRVIDAHGNTVPEASTAHAALAGEVLTWRWWDGALYLNRALAASETWAIEYRAVRSMPGNDVDPIQVNDEDLPVIVALAAESVLRRRAVEEMKRIGHASGVLAVAEAFAAEANTMLQERTRAVRSGVLTTA